MIDWHIVRSRAFLFLAGTTRRLTFGVRAALIEGDQVFLVRHTYVPGWHFPGGGVDPGESAHQAVGREISEETGYQLSAPAELFGIYHNIEATNRDHIAFFVCKKFWQARPFEPDHEIAEARWFPLTELPLGITDGTRNRLVEMSEQKPPAQIW